MKNEKKLSIVLLFLPLILCGVWQIFLGLGLTGATFWPLDIKIDECKIPNTTAIVRLYTGGFHATAPYWFSLTYKEGLLAPSRSFYNLYGSGGINSIECTQNEVIANRGGGNFEYFDVELIREELVHIPISYNKFELVEPGRSTPWFRIVLLLSGSMFVTVAISRLKRRIF